VSAVAVAPRKNPGHTVLAFDYGEKYIGIAVGDTSTRIAHPLGMVPGPRAAAALSEIDAFVREWRPDEILIGMPFAADGAAEHALSGRVRRFARRLAARYRVPVAFADERYSSTAAEETLRQTGRGARRDKHLAHALAASTILQAYLDEPSGR
jgi:putative Holliday junction resolvase